MTGGWWWEGDKDFVLFRLVAENQSAFPRPPRSLIEFNNCRRCQALGPPPMNLTKAYDSLVSVDLRTSRVVPTYGRAKASNKVYNFAQPSYAGHCEGYKVSNGSRELLRCDTRVSLHPLSRCSSLSDNAVRILCLVLDRISSLT